MNKLLRFDETLPVVQRRNNNVEPDGIENIFPWKQSFSASGLEYENEPFGPDSMVSPFPNLYWPRFIRIVIFCTRVQRSYSLGIVEITGWSMESSHSIVSEQMLWMMDLSLLTFTGAFSLTQPCQTLFMVKIQIYFY